MCELEKVLAEGKRGNAPVSPTGILSHLNEIGTSFGQGREEDAHEFLRWEFFFSLLNFLGHIVSIHVPGTSDGWSSYAQYTDDVLHNVDDCVCVSWKPTQKVYVIAVTELLLRGIIPNYFWCLRTQYTLCYLSIGNIAHLFSDYQYFWSCIHARNMISLWLRILCKAIFQTISNILLISIFSCLWIKETLYLNFLPYNLVSEYMQPQVKLWSADEHPMSKLCTCCFSNMFIGWISTLVGMLRTITVLFR